MQNNFVPVSYGFSLVDGMGKAKTVLVGCHDESSPLFQSFYDYLNLSVPQIYSRSVVLKAK